MISSSMLSLSLSLSSLLLNARESSSHGANRMEREKKQHKNPPSLHSNTDIFFPPADGILFTCTLLVNCITRSQPFSGSHVRFQAHKERTSRVEENQRCTHTKIKYKHTQKRSCLIWLVCFCFQLRCLPVTLIFKAVAERTIVLSSLLSQPSQWLPAK